MEWGIKPLSSGDWLRLLNCPYSVRSCKYDAAGYFAAAGCIAAASHSNCVDHLQTENSIIHKTPKSRVSEQNSAHTQSAVRSICCDCSTPLISRSPGELLFGRPWDKAISESVHTQTNPSSICVHAFHSIVCHSSVLHLYPVSLLPA